AALMKQNSDFLLHDRELRAEIDRLSQPVVADLSVPLTTEHKEEVERLKAQLAKANFTLNQNQVTADFNARTLKTSDERIAQLKKELEGSQSLYRIERD